VFESSTRNGSTDFDLPSFSFRFHAIRRLVNHHRQKIVDIGHQTFFHSLFFPPLEKGGKGEFEDWKSPSIPLCQRGMLEKAASRC
jgi:hypothetical protein